MPIATPEQYRDMLQRAFEGKYAYPAINVSNMVTANAALKGFADKKSDGIIQVSTGGGAFASGLAVQDQPLGAISIAEHIHRVADRYDVLIALHTDHCQPKAVDSFLVPLIEESERRVANGQAPLFNSHMVDASALPLNENLDLSVPLYERLAKLGMMIEIEAGVVGGEEDGAAGSHDTPAEKLYTTPEDMVEVFRRMDTIDGTYMFAATFGNVHGSYKPGAVKLRPEILKQGQDAIKEAFGPAAKFYLVFHGGSGSEKSQITETLGYGVVKMNVDTDTQYAFTRPIVDHMFRSYDEVLKVEGEVGNKKKYDPRSYLKAAEESMAARVGEACDDLESTGKSLLCGAAAV
ncbi:MAG: class II fructose-bisphosphate aldolase [Planctomycetales bacterium]|nr:class II fructose-bisphosphate aldolase [Planctomycetales bacterium]